MIGAIKSRGFYIEECGLGGERKRDGRVPAQHNTIQLSKNRWFVVYETRGFRGVDDNCSCVYQVRRDRPDGSVLAEGYLEKSIDDWDPLGDGRHYVRQCNHSTVFGLPKSALIEGRVPPQGESFLGRKWLIGKKIKKELNKPEGISHAKMV